MIAKGNLHANGAKLARYLLSGEKGEIAELVEARGLEGFGNEPVAAFAMLQRLAETETRCQKPFFHGHIRLPADERLSDEQWMEAVDRTEKRLGFTGQPRIVSFHIDPVTGEKHLHAGWYRIDLETMRAIDPGMYKNHLKQLSRTLEKDFALREVSNYRQPHDRARIADRKEVEESRRLGTDVRAIRTAILDCLEQCDGGKAFKAALEDKGLLLTNGDRRDCFVVVDEAGGQHALNKKLTGLTLAITRDRLADLDRAQLPSVAQAQEIQAERQAARSAQEARQRRERGAGVEETRGAARGPYAPLQAEPPHHETKALGKTAGEIRLAWTLTNTAAQFAERLEDKGLILVYVTGEEARASERARAFTKAIERQSRTLKEGFAVVDSRGNVTRIDQRVTGDQWEEIQKRLGGIERGELLTVAQAREKMRETNRAAWAAEREKARPASWIESRIVDCARPAPALALKDAEGRTATAAEALADRFRPDGERILEAKTVHGAEAFAARLEEAGITITRVTAGDVTALAAWRFDEEMKRTAAETNRETYQGRRFAELEAGELAGVTRSGDVHRINPAKLGDAAHYLAADLPNVTEARARFESEREQTAAQWTQRHEDTAERATARFEGRAAEQEFCDVSSATRHAVQGGIAAAAQAGERGFKTTRKLLAGATKVFETGFNLLFGWAMAPPKLTRQEAHDQARAENNQETIHAREYAAGVQADRAAQDWQIFQENKQQQETDLRLAQTLGLPATAEANTREHGRERGRER